MNPRSLPIAVIACVTLSCASVESLVDLNPAGAPAAATTDLPKLETQRAAFEQAAQSGRMQTLWELANEKITEDPKEPITLHYTVDIKTDAVIDISAGWCAQNTAVLSDNLEHLTPIVIVDGRSLAPDDTETIEWDVSPGEDPGHPNGMTCKSWDVLASQWPVGTHTVTEGFTLDADVNDGTSDYAAGDYLYEYTITVSE